MFSYVVYPRVYHPGFDEEVPNTVAVIELEEGPRMISTLVDAAPETVGLGQAVEVVFDTIAPEVALPRFRRVG